MMRRYCTRVSEGRGKPLLRQLLLCVGRASQYRRLALVPFAGGLTKQVLQCEETSASQSAYGRVE